MTNNTTNVMQSEPEDVSFLDIVWGQFKKNKMAYAAMWLSLIHI